MPPIGPADAGDGFDDDDATLDEEFLDEFGTPLLPPDDRLWRHPSEVAALASPTAGPASSPAPVRAGAPWGVAVVAGLIGATLTLGVVAALGGFETTVVEQQVAVRSLLGSSEAASPVADMTEATAEAVVAITADPRRAGTGGSGVVIRSDGYIVTNAHVVGDPRRLDVVLPDGTMTEAELVGTDPVTDLAVIRVRGVELQPALVGSDGVRVGAPAIAIGNGPSGASVTTGVVSGIGRRLQRADGVVLHDMLLVDLPIAAEATGGPLVDDTGAVIGITNGVAVDGDERLGTATPIDLAMYVAHALIDDGEIRHAWLGIEGSDVRPEQAETLGVDTGVTISDVIAGGPADAAGIRPDDVILAVDGSPVTSMSSLIRTLRTSRPGDVVALRIWRDDAPTDVQCELAERPDDG